MGGGATGVKVLVTGGGGFLGGKIAAMLHQRGDDVTALGRNRYPALEREGIKTTQADVRDAQAIQRACEGMDVVFHTAAVAGIWGKRDTYYQINTVGTRNVLAACLACGVGKLIFTSSPSVAIGGGAIRGVDESIAYPKRYLTHYSETKAIAEREVLEANGDRLLTVALRPHLIWGPGDPHLMPRVVDRARRKKLVRVGDGSNLVDITYIDNAARAHLQAADALASGSPCAGRAYFITNGEPLRLWEWFARVLEAVGAPPVTRSMSYPTAYRIGAALEWTFRLLGIRREPLMTRFLAGQLGLPHYFDILAARRDFGYTVEVSVEQGTGRLVEWLLEGSGQDVRPAEPR